MSYERENSDANDQPADWLQFLRSHDAGEELDLESLHRGDLLVVETGHTRYNLRILQGREAELRTNREDRPSGRVIIQGCTFGDSSSIKPNALFCGGNLEFTYEQGRMVHKTSMIRIIRTARGVAKRIPD
jgi:hypothetical protein